MSSILAVRNARHNQIRSDNAPLTDEQIRSVAPSIFAQQAHDSRSKHYAYVPTIEVVNELRKNGFEPFVAAQAKVNRKGLLAGKQEFTRHMLRLRHPNTVKNKDGAHEIIIINSHDGTSSYQMLSGFFRFVCMNGLVCGTVDHNTRLRHSKIETKDVIDVAYKVLDNTANVDAVIGNMQTVRMPIDQQMHFARQAIALRFGEAAGEIITTAQALEPRRSEDSGNDRWSIFNRVQENLENGGMIGRVSPKGKKPGNDRKVRPITAMDKAHHFNRDLWQLMANIG